MKQQDPVRNAFRSYAAQLSAEHSAPPASAVWLRSERRNRKLVLERATWPLRIMQPLSLIIATFMCAWTLHQSGSTIDPTLLLWGLLAALIVVAGCWTMLRAGRRLSP